MEAKQEQNNTFENIGSILDEVLKNPNAVSFLQKFYQEKIEGLKKDNKELKEDRDKWYEESKYLEGKVDGMEFIIEKRYSGG